MEQLNILKAKSLTAGRQMPMSIDRKDEDREASEDAVSKLRVSIDISPELYAKLQGLARDVRGTKSDVIRKSLALMDVAVQARKNGKRIGIADKDEHLSTEIIGFEY